MKAFLLPIVFTISFLQPVLSNAALVARDLDGNPGNGHEGVYDDVLDITWLADANLAASNTFGVSGINALGQMDWNTAENLVAAMNTDNAGIGYLGVTSWRQVAVTPVNGIGLNLSFSYDGSTDASYQLSAPVHPTFNQSGQSAGSTSSELAYHYSNNLGGISACSGIGGSITYGCVLDSVYGVDDATNLENLSLFSHIQNARYWTGTEPVPGSSNAFYYETHVGFQGNHNLSENHVWLVTDGDIGSAITSVPLPGALWGFASAFAYFIGMRLR